MHLLSQHDQKVCIGGETLFFRRGETILTEYSHKWTLPAFSRLAASAGLGVEQVWTDEKQWFSVQLLRAMS